MVKELDGICLLIWLTPILNTHNSNGFGCMGEFGETFSSWGYQLYKMKGISIVNQTLLYYHTFEQVSVWKLGVLKLDLLISVAKSVLCYPTIGTCRKVHRMCPVRFPWVRIPYVPASSLSGHTQKWHSKTTGASAQTPSDGQRLKHAHS